MTRFALLVLFCCSCPLCLGCASASKDLVAEMKPLALAAAPLAPLRDDHFSRDTPGGVSEDDLKKILSAPLYLESAGRVGVVPVASGYEPEGGLPLPAVPAELSGSLEDAGLFQSTTEVSTDWPAARGVSGLRELAARYRATHLLLYRQRFVEEVRLNGFAWLYPTILGALALPGQTMETDGVLEATLFDVRSGTILFTVFERVHAVSEENVWHEEYKMRELQKKLLAEAARKLADKVVDKAQRLAAARPGERGDGGKVAVMPD